jgi:hypothetical protein
VAVAAAVLDLFWRLPRSAVRFLETQHAAAGQPGAAAAGGGQPGGGAARQPGGGQQPGLVVLTIQLEEKLPRMPLPSTQSRILTSAYREPLLRFLNK